MSKDERIAAAIALFKSARDDAQQMEELLREAHKEVCSNLCPSTWPTGQKLPHSDLCQRITRTLPIRLTRRPTRHYGASMDYIRDYYKVPAKRGGRIKYKGKLGTITGSRGARLRIRLDGEKQAGNYHPTWEIEYL